ncbi:MAG: DinB family protein [Candidatus Acidiferrum sp.]
MAPELDPLIANLARTQSIFLRAADAVAAEEWNTRPSQERWSAAELVVHLMMVERAVIEKADRVTQKLPRRIGLLKRIHIPMMLVELRVIRRKSPIPLAPELLRAKEEMLAELREVRGRSRAFLEETRDRDLRDYCWKHPALGTLNTYEWMRFISAHEVRHTKQMREIAASLPKVIERLQK